MKSIDLNADLGEYRSQEEQECERQVLHYVTSCNIACGGHIGDAHSMGETLMAARSAGVIAGAHPSYPDRDGFGRRSLDIETEELKQSILRQLHALKVEADAQGTRLAHVKPHGALYNDAMDDTRLSGMLADCVSTVLPGAALVGMPGSVFATIVEIRELRFIAEAFIDRRYMANSRLVSRQEQGAMILDVDAQVSQAVTLTEKYHVMTQDGDEISVKADTLCLHGDNPSAVVTAREVRRALENAGISVQALTPN